MNAVQWSLGIEPQFNYGHDLIGGPHSAEPDKVMTVIWWSYESRKWFHMTVASDFAEKICLVYTKHIFLVDCHIMGDSHIFFILTWNTYDCHMTSCQKIWHTYDRHGHMTVIWQSYDKNRGVCERGRDSRWCALVCIYCYQSSNTNNTTGMKTTSKFRNKIMCDRAQWQQNFSVMSMYNIYVLFFLV